MIVTGGRRLLRARRVVSGCVLLVVTMVQVSLAHAYSVQDPSDMALRNRDTGDLAMIVNDSIGGFAWWHSYQLGGFGASQQWTPLVGDFDGRNGDDVMARNRDTGDTAIAYNDGNGRLGWTGGYISELSGVGASQNWTPLVGDFAGDAAADLMLRNRATGDVAVVVSGSNGFAWWHGYQLSGFGASEQWTPLVGDFDGRNGDDLMVRNRDTGDTAVAHNDGSGRLAWTSGYVLSGIGASQAWAPLIGDFGNDAAEDLMLRNRDTGDVVVLVSDSQGGFAWWHGYQLSGFGGSQQWAPLVGNFDGHHGDDLIARNRDTGDVAIAYNDGTGRLAWNGGYNSELSGIGSSQTWAPLVGMFGSGYWASFKYGGKNHWIDTSDERASAFQAYVDSSDKGRFWDGLTPEDREALADIAIDVGGQAAGISVGTTQPLDNEGYILLGEVPPPDAGGSADASAAAAGVRGCKITTNHETVKLKRPVLPDPTIANFTQRVRWCYNRERSKVAWDGHLLDLTWNQPWYIQVGWHVTVDPEKINFLAPWGGVAKGRVHMERRVTLEFCVPTKPVCPRSKVFRMILLGHYDGHAEDASGFA